MDRDEVLRRLQPVFDGVFVEPVTVTAALSAEDVAEWDSLTHVSLVVAVEEAFGIRFHVGEVETTANVGAFADLIARRVAAR